MSFAGMVFAVAGSALAAGSSSRRASDLEGVLFLCATIAATVVVVRWWNKRTGPRTVTTQKLSALLPADCGVRVDAVHVGIHRRWEHTGYSVMVSGGVGHAQAQGRAYKVLDFGWTVRNLASQYQRVQLAVSRISRDGHPVYSWIDLAPGEMRRLWFGLEMRSAHQFVAHDVSELSVGPVPPGGSSEGTQFNITVHPNLGFNELLECDRAGIWRFFPLNFLHSLIVYFGVVMVLVALAAIAGSIWEFLF